MLEKELEIAGGSLCYIPEESGIRITQLKGLVSEVVVPEEVEGLPVTGIGKKCFMGKRSLMKVILPDTVQSIGDFCFAGDTALCHVSLPGRPLSFGKTPFLNCTNLKQIAIRQRDGRPEAPGGLLALAAVDFGSYYLLDTMEAGSDEWFRKWDARLLMELHTPDMEGHTNAVLCGEEDYESTSPEGFVHAKRILKAKHCLCRLLFSEKLEKSVRQELETYLREHTKGAESEEAWQVILGEYGDEKAYYSLFAETGCVTADNLDGILADIGEDHPEMKAYFLRYKGEKLGEEDFFAGLEL